MTDLISRQAAIKAVDDLPNCYNGYSDTYDKSCIIGLLEELPSTEPEIVRCKDCKYYTSVTAKCEIRGKGLYLIRGLYDFCSKAERRTDE